MARRHGETKSLVETGLGDNPGVTTPVDDWSPADASHAIAVSEAQWWQRTVQLALLRLRGPDDERISWFSSRQIDARQLIFALRQLLSAEQLAQEALRELGMDQAVCDALDQARRQFEDAVPGVKDMRDALVHFEEWSRGLGRGPQKAQRAAAVPLREIARDFWGFGYDPSTETITLGPYTINAESADRAADELSRSIYLAAHAIDKRNTARRHAKTVAALTAAGIVCNTPDAPVMVSAGSDLKVWVSLPANTDKADRRMLAARLRTTLADAGLRLSPAAVPGDLDTVDRLVRGEALHCEPVS